MFLPYCLKEIVIVSATTLGSVFQSPWLNCWNSSLVLWSWYIVLAMSLKACKGDSKKAMRFGEVWILNVSSTIFFVSFWGPSVIALHEGLSDTGYFRTYHRELFEKQRNRHTRVFQNYFRWPSCQYPSYCQSSPFQALAQKRDQTCSHNLKTFTLSI